MRTPTPPSLTCGGAMLNRDIEPAGDGQARALPKLQHTIVKNGTKSPARTGRHPAQTQDRTVQQTAQKDLIAPLPAGEGAPSKWAGR